MNYTCPNCAFGNLKPVNIVYVRRWGDTIATVPNFAAWRCDSCNYTRYDMAALSKVEAVFGPDEDDWFEPRRHYPRRTEGPGERGPRRWPS